jgi:hypothetical protein
MQMTLKMVYILLEVSCFSIACNIDVFYNNFIPILTVNYCELHVYLSLLFACGCNFPLSAVEIESCYDALRVERESGSFGCSG